MDIDPQFNVTMINALFMLAAGLSGGMVALSIKTNERIQLGILSAGLGIALGSTFLGLLPEGLSSHKTAVMVLAGLLISVLLNFPGTQDKQENPRWETVAVSFAGLSIAALLLGLYTTIQLSDPITRNHLVTWLMVMKFAEAAILGSLIVLAETPRNVSLAMIAVFSILTPIAMVVSQLLYPHLTDYYLSIFFALATGLIVYILLAEITPYIFRTVKVGGKWIYLLLVIIGGGVVEKLI